MFFKVGVLKNFAIFTEKHVSESLFNLKKKDSSTGFFLWILQNFNGIGYWQIIKEMLNILNLEKEAKLPAAKNDLM